jgi:hypothetical protein
MKTINAILLLSVLGLNSSGQNIKEKVMLFTDRSLYITGENILFSALLSPDAGSSILYCEIITPEGSAVAGGKFNIANSRSSGSLYIPSDLVTGNYFIRAYTKLMRNDGPFSFSYLQIAIINPYLNEVLSNETMPEADNIQVKLQKESADYVKIIPDKKLAGTGDSIHVTLLNNSPQQSFRNISLAVVPDSLPQYSQVILPGTRFEKESFSPEINGVHVTGSVTEKTGGQSIKDMIVNLSILGRGRDFMTAITDSAGRFAFILRGYSGYRDLFLCTAEDSVGQKITIDNDFCTTPIAVPASHFSLTQAERRAAYRMALNVQVDSLFRIKLATDTSPADNIGGAYFYGTPDETIKIDNYVQLPALEDYFNELPTLVKIRKSGGHKYFRILGDQTGLSEFHPLVMIDLVALNDPGRIAGISPRDLDRIEVINSFYVKGAQVYGGIINLISKRGDFAGIDLPSSGVFARYGFPVEKTDEIKFTAQKSGPDARNTLIWIPHLILTTQSTFSFTAPPTPGRYLITVKGVTADGREFISAVSFEVLPG